ncbi:MAG: hypothetical protein ACRDIV_26760 [Ktedonobacteraceae bacterium]
MVSTVQMITKIAPLTLAEYAEMPYAPALLLDSKFDASITDDSEFHHACESGFRAYFDGMYEWNEEGTDTVFVAKCYTWADVVALVDETAWSTGLHDWRSVSFAWGAGFGLGWLSVHALVHRDDAVMALGRLTARIEGCMEKRRGVVA